jgi:hypothetical protein
MRRRPLVGLIFLLGVTPALAEEPAPNPAAAATENLQQVAPGDHWTYAVKDEISGAVQWTRTDRVTDVSKSQITVRFDIANTSRSGVMVYDRSWNVVRDGPFRYLPNDGTGDQFPLTPGAQWKFAIDVINSSNGQTFRRVGNSRVTGQESIKTRAGTFDTFAIETNYTGKGVQDPTFINQASGHTWFSPDVNHWVKRSIVIRRNGNVIENNTIELTDYGHKKQ